MSALCTVPGCTCALVHVKRVEVRDGRRYVDGVDQGPAQPENNALRNYQQKGGAATRGGPRRKR